MTPTQVEDAMQAFLATVASSSALLATFTVHVGPRAPCDPGNNLFVYCDSWVPMIEGDASPVDYTEGVLTVEFVYPIPARTKAGWQELAGLLTTIWTAVVTADMAIATGIRVGGTQAVQRYVGRPDWDLETSHYGARWTMQWWTD